MVEVPAKTFAAIRRADQRYYSPGTGRFLTADPFNASAGAENPSSWNRYAYVEGDPINKNDPAGLMAGSVNCDAAYSMQECFGEAGRGTGVTGGGMYCDDGKYPFITNSAECGAFNLAVWQAATKAGGKAVSNLIPVIIGVAVGSSSGVTAGSVIAGISAIAAGIGIGELIVIQKKQKEDDIEADRIDCEKLEWPGAPEDNNRDKPPGPGWRWGGPADKGQWHNPSTGESLRPHPGDSGHRPHWDYVGPKHTDWRVYGPGDCEKKQ